MISCCAFRSFDFPLRQGFGGQGNFVQTIKMLTTEPFFTTLLGSS
jgi:hypothetical protein